MLIARRLSDGAISPDFQTHATADVLIANAVRSGFVADETDLEVIEVTRPEFEQLIEDMYGAQREAERQMRERRRQRVMEAAQVVVGKRIDQFTPADVRALVIALAYPRGAFSDTLHVLPLDWLDE